MFSDPLGLAADGSRLGSDTGSGAGAIGQLVGKIEYTDVVLDLDDWENVYEAVSGFRFGKRTPKWETSFVFTNQGVTVRNGGWRPGLPISLIPHVTDAQANTVIYGTNITMESFVIQMGEFVGKLMKSQSNKDLFYSPSGVTSPISAPFGNRVRHQLAVGYLMIVLKYQEWAVRPLLESHELGQVGEDTQIDTINNNAAIKRAVSGVKLNCRSRQFKFAA